MKAVLALLSLVTVVLAAEREKTPSQYFGSIFQQWNYLVLRCRNKDSLGEHATSLLLPMLERNGLKQKLSKALMGDSTTKSSMQFTTAVTGTSLKNAAGMNDNAFFKDTTKITTAVTTLKDALCQGFEDMAALELTLPTDATEVITYCNETLTEAASLIPNATLGQGSLKDQNPGVRDCVTGEPPKSAKMYFDKLWLYANQLHIKARSIYGSDVADTMLDRSINRNKEKLSFGKELGSIDSLKLCKICFTFTSTPRKHNNLGDLMDIRNIKDEAGLATALSYLYTAFEQGLIDVKQQFVNRGRYTDSIDQLDIARLDNCFKPVRECVETIVNTTADYTSQNITNSCTQLDESGTGGTSGTLLVILVSTGTCNVNNPTVAWQNEILAEHNTARTNVQPPARDMCMMEWDDCLASVAQAYLDTCPGFNHNSDRSTQAQDAGCTVEQVGENMYWTSATNLTDDDMTSLVASVVGEWVAEAAYYDFDTGKCSDVCGHYTQVVWTYSTRLGCAYKNDCCDGGEGTIILCNYDPAGNWEGWCPYTDGTSCSGCPGGGACEDNLCCLA